MYEPKKWKPSISKNIMDSPSLFQKTSFLSLMSSLATWWRTNLSTARWHQTERTTESAIRIKILRDGGKWLKKSLLLFDKIMNEVIESKLIKQWMVPNWQEQRMCISIQKRVRDKQKSKFNEIIFDVGKYKILSSSLTTNG